MPKIAELKVDGDQVWARVELEAGSGVALWTLDEQRENARQHYNNAIIDAIVAAQKALLDTGHGKTANNQAVEQIVNDLRRLRKPSP